MGHSDNGGRTREPDHEFLEALERRIQDFIASGEPEVALEPMNSFRRHQVHEMAVQFNLKSESKGEGHERHICLLHNPQEAIPQKKAPARQPEKQPDSQPSRQPARPSPRLPDFGSQTFPVKPGTSGILLVLKEDGSIMIKDDKDTHDNLSERLVTTRQIRIRNGKIVQPGDPEW